MDETSPEVRLQRALELAYRYLGSRDRTVHEMRSKLESKGHDEETIADALQELTELGYLDDARFAQRFAEDRRTLDSWGSDRIERRLRDLGVEREHIAAAVGAGEENELEAAVELLRRRFPVPPETDRDRNRALGLLARRGYDLDVAYDAIRALARARL